MRLVLSCLVLACGCGGEAVIDAGHGGGGGQGGSPANECEGQPCGAPCRIGDYPGPPTGMCTDDEQCAYDTTCTSPCAGKQCGDSCVVCNPVECLEGFCGDLGACAPELTDCG